MRNLFGFERYDGGAVVVHALRLEIGDDAFFELLQRWVAENDGTSRHDRGLHRAAVGGRRPDLTAFFATWLDSPTLPGLPRLIPTRVSRCTRCRDKGLARIQVLGRHGILG